MSLKPNSCSPFDIDIPRITGFAFKVGNNKKLFMPKGVMNKYNKAATLRV
jgi:hypothetical protein